MPTTLTPIALPCSQHPLHARGYVNGIDVRVFRCMRLCVRLCVRLVYAQMKVRQLATVLGTDLATMRSQFNPRTLLFLSDGYAQPPQPQAPCLRCLVPQLRVATHCVMWRACAIGCSDVYAAASMAAQGLAPSLAPPAAPTAPARSSHQAGRNMGSPPEAKEFPATDPATKVRLSAGHVEANLESDVLDQVPCFVSRHRSRQRRTVLTIWVASPRCGADVGVAGCSGGRCDEPEWLPR